MIPPNPAEKDAPMDAFGPTLARILMDGTPIEFRNYDFTARYPERREAENARIAKWMNIVANGNSAIFARRLEWDDLDITVFRQNPRSSADTKRPLWLTSVEHLAKHLPSSSPSHIPGNSYPFCSLIEAVIDIIINKAQERAEHHWKILLSSAIVCMRGSCAAHLCWLLSETLGIEFEVYKSCRYAANDLTALASLLDPNSDLLYQSFIAELRGDGLLNLFSEYPVLARLLGVAINSEIEFLAEFVIRLGTDAVLLPKLLKNTDDIAQVSHLEMSNSDRHNGARRVIILTFASGERLVYKPKCLDIDDAFQNFLNWCNLICEQLALVVPRVICRGSYGWTQFFDAAPCLSSGDVHNYYRRIGKLLCLTYLLGGTDFHCENIIASADHPILVDLETFFTPKMRLLSHDRPFSPVVLFAQEQIRHSVLSSGLLPRWELGNNGLAYDLTGLGGKTGQVTPSKIAVWKDINTDRMQLSFRSTAFPKMQHQPVLNFSVQPAENYVADIAEGFESLYFSIMQHRETLMRSDGPLHSFENATVRFLHRPTRVYWDLLSTSNHPDYFRAAIDRRIYFDILAKAFVSENNRPPLWPLVDAECDSLEGLDIPHFCFQPNSLELNTNKNKFCESFEVSGLEMAKERIRNLSVDDCTLQTAFIQGAFHAYLSRDSYVSSQYIQKADNSETHYVLSDSERVEAAIGIARQLWGMGIHLQNAITWIAPQYNPKNARFQYEPIRFSLYDGCCGIGLFFAALAKVTGDNIYRNWAGATLEPLYCEVAAGLDAQFEERLGLGCGTGVGSIIYSLIRISDLLNDQRPLEMAQRCASRLTKKILDAESNPDLSSGLAGALIGLLTIYSRVGNPMFFELASHCGQRLIEQRSIQTGEQAWTTLHGLALAGMAHGAAGITCSLLKLFSINGSKAVYSTAELAISYENSLYDDYHSNWKDLRTATTGEGDGFMNSWCHGAAGIGMARMAGLPMLNSIETMRDIERSLNTVLSAPIGGPDHLCCGVCGRIEALCIAGDVLKRPELKAEAARRISFVVQNSKEQGFNLFGSEIRAIANPGFFRGTSGIGYQLLRTAKPDLVPSILTFC